MSSNLEQYKVFYYVCELGGITKASEKLCLSQPAVSQAVRQLEAALGCRLFWRTARGAKPTREGELLHKFVKSGLESIWKGESVIRSMLELEGGTVRVGASDMTLQFYLLPFLEAFHERYPKVKVTVSNGPTPETIENLKKGAVDFAVVSTPFGESPDLESVPVKKINNVFVAGRGFDRLAGKKLDYEVLKKLPCIFLERNTSTRAFMDKYLEGKDMKVEPEFELATSDMVVQFAVRNLGVGCVMSEFAEKEIAQGQLFCLDFREKMPERRICIVTDRRNPVSPAGVKLLNLLYGK